MRITLGALSWLLLSSVAVGCGGGGDAGQFSCSAAMNGVPVICVEGNGLAASEVESNRRSCEQQGSTFSTSPCSHERALGGCRMSRDGATLTTWYYEDTPAHTTEDQQSIREICAGLGVQFVGP